MRKFHTPTKHNTNLYNQYAKYFSKITYKVYRLITASFPITLNLPASLLLASGTHASLNSAILTSFHDLPANM